MTRQRIKRQLENNGYRVELYDAANNTYSATATWDGRTLYGKLGALYRQIFG